MMPLNFLVGATRSPSPRGEAHNAELLMRAYQILFGLNIGLTRFHAMSGWARPWISMILLHLFCLGDRLSVDLFSPESVRIASLTYNLQPAYRD